MTSIENITERQIKTLREEALAASDYDQAAICDAALATHPRYAPRADDYTAISPTLARKLDKMTRRDALAACAKAINASTAQ